MNKKMFLLIVIVLFITGIGFVFVILNNKEQYILDEMEAINYAVDGLGVKAYKVNDTDESKLTYVIDGRCDYLLVIDRFEKYCEEHKDNPININNFYVKVVFGNSEPILSGNIEFKNYLDDSQIHPKIDVVEIIYPNKIYWEDMSNERNPIEYLIFNSVVPSDDKIKCIQFFYNVKHIIGISNKEKNTEDFMSRVYEIVPLSVIGFNQVLQLMGW